MNEIITELSKPVWWVSVVVAGILINLLSSYLKTGVDSWTSKLIANWNQRSEKNKREWLELIESIKQSDAHNFKAISTENRLRLQSIHLLLLAIFVSNFPFVASLEVGDKVRWFNLLSYLFATTLFFMSFLAFTRAARTAEAIRRSGR